jgi:hypothetical protein
MTRLIYTLHRSLRPRSWSCLLWWRPTTSSISVCSAESRGGFSSLSSAWCSCGARASRLHPRIGRSIEWLERPGSVGDQEGQFTALLWIRIVTTVVTTVMALVLSKVAPAIRAEKVWVLQLAAVSQVGLAFVGLIIVPFVALTIWNDYVDFQAYSLKPGFLLLLLPTAAVVFCLTRGGSSKNRED